MNHVPKADRQGEENDAELTEAGATRNRAGSPRQINWGATYAVPEESDISTFPPG